MTTGPDDGVVPLPDLDVTQVAPFTPQPIVSIGPYRLLERIGEGGMGEVWLAEQARPVHRQVALKVIKAGMDTAQVLARFDAERQALALMDHPAIARVFDGGATPQGRPYFVMEFVRGESITAYATRHKLALRERIELFIQVCEGVQHAHQKGIIHRDLKPSNILVTVRDDQPAPKIIDFGVAKAMTQSLTERTLHTEMGALVGTPEYMSPEQAEMGGLDIDTRTDVYALGVILYELLTDTLPFDPKSLREKSLDEIRRVIREVDPPRPSTRVTTLASTRSAGHRSADTTRLGSQLRGDLDWITMKALEKDRTRRYATVGDLTADLKRHLDDQPVLASPPSAVYRLQKFVRRNRLTVTAAVTLVVLLVAFATTMAVQARRIAHERDRANREAQRASIEAGTSEQVTNFLVSLFRINDPSEERGAKVTARDMLVRAAAALESDNKIDPKLEVKMLRAIHGAYAGLGLYSESERITRKTMTVAERTFGATSREALLETISLCALLVRLHRITEAESACQRAANNLTRDENTAEKNDVLNNLAAVLLEQGRFADAERRFREIITLPDVTPPQPRLKAQAMNNLGAALHMQRKYEDARLVYEQAIAMRSRSLGPDDPGTLRLKLNLGETLLAAGHLDDAERVITETLPRLRKVLPPDHPTIGTAMLILADLMNRRSNFEGGHSLAEGALQIRSKAFASDTFAVAEAEQALAVSLIGLKRFQDAEQLAIHSYNSIAKASQTDAITKQEALKVMTSLYEHWGQKEKAVEWRAKLSESTGKP